MNNRLRIASFALMISIVGTQTSALGACQRDGALFVGTGIAAERDVPKSAAIRIALGANGSANFRCIIITNTNAVLDWAEATACPAGSPSLVTRWRSDGTIGTSCDIPVAQGAAGGGTKNGD